MYSFGARISIWILWKAYSFLPKTPSLYQYFPISNLIYLGAKAFLNVNNWAIHRSASIGYIFFRYVSHFFTSHISELKFFCLTT